MSKSEKNLSSKQQIVRQFAVASTMGLEFFFTIAIFYFIGNYLDKKFHTEPYIMIGFVFFGIVAAFVNFYQNVMKLNKK